MSIVTAVVFSVLLLIVTGCATSSDPSDPGETKGSDPLNLCAHALDGHRADGLHSAVIQGPSVSRHSGTDG